MAYGFAIHGLLTKIIVPRIKLPSVEEASNMIRKWLVTTIQIMPTTRVASYLVCQYYSMQGSALSKTIYIIPWIAVSDTKKTS